MAQLPQFDSIYHIFSTFLQRCLLEDGSLLFPPAEIWTIANLELVRRRFVEGFIQGRMTFREKLETQLNGVPGEVWALIADCFYIYGLPSRSMRYQTKKGWVEWAGRHAGLPLPADEDLIWEPLRTGFAATGQKYNLKHAQLRLLVLLALEVKAAPDPAALISTPQALQTLLENILEAIPLKIDRANDMRSAILYMAFPAVYEPILSSQEKDAILRHYAAHSPEPLSADRDEALRQVRAQLEPRFADFGHPFDFMTDLRDEWRSSPSGLERAISAEINQVRQIREQAPGWQISKDPDLQRVLSTLHLTRNVILSGPPGAGKTYIAQKAARSLVESQGPNPDSFVVWVTLHPSYSYEDFVEGLRPVLAVKGESGTGNVSYEVRPGIFREIVERAAHDPAHTYVLVVDEINRGNLAKILGELITLLEDEKRGVLSVRLPYSGSRLTVPPNLVLLGTMNTADRSIALLDAALRRRFAFVEIAPRPDLLTGATIETEEAVLHLDDLLRCLNDSITTHLGADHRIGHSYFLRVTRAVPEERLAVLELVWNTQVLPLLEEYFYNRKDRLAEILAPFVDDGADPLSTREIMRLKGEDLVVALSRICE